MTVSEFLDAISKAEAGDRIVYHVGLLGDDRVGETGVELSVKAEVAWLLGAPKRFLLGGRDGAMDASGMGIASLTQRRVQFCIYDYAATMRRQASKVEMQILRKRATVARLEAIHALTAHKKAA